MSLVSENATLWLTAQTADGMLGFEFQLPHNSLFETCGASCVLKLRVCLTIERQHGVYTVSLLSGVWGSTV